MWFIFKSYKSYTPPEVYSFCYMFFLRTESVVIYVFPPNITSHPIQDVVGFPGSRGKKPRENTKNETQKKIQKKKRWKWIVGKSSIFSLQITIFNFSIWRGALAPLRKPWEREKKNKHNKENIFLIYEPPWFTKQAIFSLYFSMFHAS